MGRKPAIYWKNAPKEVQDYIVLAILKSYSGQDQIMRDEAIRSCGITGQTIMLAVKSMGYDSYPMIGFDPKKGGSLINLPKDQYHLHDDNHWKGSKRSPTGGGQLSLSDVVIMDHF